MNKLMIALSKKSNPSNKNLKILIVLMLLVTLIMGALYSHSSNKCEQKKHCELSIFSKDLSGMVCTYPYEICEYLYIPISLMIIGFLGYLVNTLSFFEEWRLSYTESGRDIQRYFSIIFFILGLIGGGYIYVTILLS